MAGQRSWIVALGAAVFTGALMLASYLAWATLRQPVVATFDEVVVRRDGLGVVVEAGVTILPRVRVTYEGVSGTLLVAEQRVDYVIEGIAPGDVLVPESSHAVTVRVQMGPSVVAASVIRAVSEGRVALEFDGAVDVAVLGIPAHVPLRAERELKP